MVRRLGASKYDRRIRAIVLVSMGLTLILWGWGYLSPSWIPTPNMYLLDAVVPIQVWAVVWITAGLGCLVGVFLPRVARLSMSTGASLWATWFIFYCLSWLTADAQRAWMPAAPFGMLAVAMFTFTLLMEPSSAARRKHHLVVHEPEKDE